MDDFIYDSRSEALDTTAETLAKVSDLPNQVLKSLGEKANVVEEKEQASDETLPRHLQRAIVGRFVIRNDILLSLETFLSLLKNATKLAAGIAGVATPGGIAAPAGIAALTDGLYGLYKFYTEIVAKGFKLTEDQLAVIATLRKLNTAATSEIAESLQKPLDAPIIEEILEGFSVQREPAKGFILRDELGRWQIEGL